MMNSLYGYGYGGGWMPFVPILWIVFWWAVIYLVVVWLREENTRWGDTSGNKKPLDILKERYAKWEITKEEFEAMKKDLM